MRLKVLGLEAGVFGDASEHFGADLDSFVKGEDEIGVVRMGKNFMGAGLAFDLPADGEEGLENLAALGPLRPTPAHSG